MLDRYPDYRSIPLVRKLLFKESSNFYYYLICSLDQEIDSNYVKKLISFAKYSAFVTVSFPLLFIAPALTCNPAINITSYKISNKDHAVSSS